LPARRHSFFEDSLPDVVVCDSSFVFDAAVNTGEIQHEAGQQFAQRLRRHHALLVYSSLLFIEAAQCWRRLFRKGIFGRMRPSIEDRIEAFGFADKLLTDFLNAFGCQEIAITKPLMAAASRLVAHHDLSAHDALVVAVAQELGVTHIASFDRDFRRLDGIELWDGLLVR
jgi:predicted nucleic acid-binding protein